MPAKARRPRSSRGRSNTVGLLFVLLAAVALGAGVGTFVGNEFGKPQARHNARRSAPSAAGRREVTQPPENTPRRTSAKQSGRRSDENDESSRPALSVQSKAFVPDRDKATSEAQPPAPPPPAPPPTPKPKRRPAGMPGEVSHVAGSMKVALTLDAGASAAPTPSILKTLAASGVQVTFFLTGKWAEQNEGLVRRIRSEGHEIGNHTYSHPDLRKLSDAGILDQLKKTDDIIARITGRECDPLFRPPFGSRDRRVLRVAGDAGFACVYWSLDSWDSYKKGITSQEITERVLSRVQGGDIVLMHCGSQATADALPGLINALESRGYGIVKVSELLRG